MRAGWLAAVLGCCVGVGAARAVTGVNSRVESRDGSG